jgi:ABC-type phosphate transport system substrate-binding protein
VAYRTRTTHTTDRGPPVRTPERTSVTTLKLIAVAGIAGLATTLGATSAAFADPVSPTGPRVLAGVGSDTTQDVVNALSDVVLGADGSKLVASYDATPTGSTITTRASAGCTFARPNGSGAGRTALLKALNPADPTFGCLDFSRSSSLNLAATDYGLTYIPFAVDAISYAVTSGSSVPKNLTKAQLSAIYTCQDPTVPAPLLPQAGSGTRAFWLATLGLTETTKGACVVDAKAGVSVQENSGAALTGPTDIVPFSVANYVAQANGAAADTRGSAVLGSVDGVAPTTGSGTGLALNSSFGIKRSVYNVVPTAKLADATIASVFVGAGSKVCQQPAVVQRLGFGIASDCGSTTNRSATTGVVTPVPNPTPATPTPTSATPTSGTRLPLTARLSSSTTVPAAAVTLTVTGTPGATVELVAYSRPATTYAPVRSATLDSAGRASFSVAPGSNTRLYVRYTGDDTTASTKTALSVRTAISLSARRVGARSYVFEGRLLPRRAGQLITLYRVVNGTPVVTSQVKSDSTGTWRIPRRFTGNGAFSFQARTGQTLDNAAGSTNVVRVTVR